MNKQIFTKTLAVSLLMSSLDATRVRNPKPNGTGSLKKANADGTGGSPPCILSYQGKWMEDDIGQDPHALHGLQAEDGSFVAVGNSIQNMSGDRTSGTYGFIYKTQPNCQPDSGNPTVYYGVDGQGEECTNYSWVSKFGDIGKITLANWVAESPDGSYYIMVGLE